MASPKGPSRSSRKAGTKSKPRPSKQAAQVNPNKRNRRGKPMRKRVFFKPEHVEKARKLAEATAAITVKAVTAGRRGTATGLSWLADKIRPKAVA